MGGWTVSCQHVSTVVVRSECYDRLSFLFYSCERYLFTLVLQTGLSPSSTTMPRIHRYITQGVRTLSKQIILVTWASHAVALKQNGVENEAELSDNMNVGLLLGFVRGRDVKIKHPWSCP
jgi:hypothetical protein